VRLVATTLGGQELEEKEMIVLFAFPGRVHRLTVGQLKARTGFSVKELRCVIEGLRAKGILVRLNTVIESYAMPSIDGRAESATHTFVPAQEVRAG
jgi:hypothetical protein